jgi:hypothetical protein
MKIDLILFRLAIYDTTAPGKFSNSLHQHSTSATMASFSDKRQLRPAHSDYHDDTREVPPPAKRMKQDGSGNAGTTTTIATNSFSVFSAATMFSPVTATAIGAPVIGNGIFDPIRNERISEMIQTKHHDSISGSGSGTNNTAYWSSPLAKTLHYYEA